LIPLALVDCCLLKKSSRDVPTRLLDFTTDPNVALFFALYNKNKQYHIITINTNDEVCEMINFSNNDISSTFVPSPNCNPILTEKCASVFEKALNSNKINIINPPRTNERLERQKGVFIMPGSFNSNDFIDLLVKNSTIIDINPSCRFELINYPNAFIQGFLSVDM